MLDSVICLNKYQILRVKIFCQIKTFIKVRMAFVFGFQTLQLLDFTRIFQLKGLKPKNKGRINFYECCDLMKKVYLTSICKLVKLPNRLVIYSHSANSQSCPTYIQQYIELSLTMKKLYFHCIVPRVNCLIFTTRSFKILLTIGLFKNMSFIFFWSDTCPKMKQAKTCQEIGRSW